MAPIETVIKPGDSVIIERDHKLYPPKGSWSSYDGRLGTVTTINRADAEYGVGFQKATTDSNGYIHAGPVSWFKLHELMPVQDASST